MDTLSDDPQAESDSEPFLTTVEGMYDDITANAVKQFSDWLSSLWMDQEKAEDASQS